MKLKIQAFAIIMILFGSPIIHFFRDFMGVLPKTPLIMPAFSALFFAMIFIGSKNWTKIYKPNFNISAMAWLFLGYSIFMALISYDRGKPLVESLNYVFLLVYFFLLCMVPKEVGKVMVPIIILVALFDNFALLIAFIKNPFTQLGQRAIISDAGWGEGAGNPSLYSFMAFTGFIASIIYFKSANVFWKIVAIITALTGIAVMLMTLIRATMFTLIICAAFYLFFNFKKIFKKGNYGPWYNYGFSKSNFFLFALFFLIGVIALFFISPKIVNSLLVYVENSTRTLSNVIDSILATEEKKALSIDPSAANRMGTFNYSLRLLSEQPIRIIYGYGYKFLYVDIPLMQVFLEEGIIGLSLLLMFHFFVMKNTVLAMQVSTNQWITLLAYYYLLLLVNSISRGEPYEPYFWNYFLTIARFMKPEDMLLGSKKELNSGKLMPTYA